MPNPISLTDFKSYMDILSIVDVEELEDMMYYVFKLDQEFLKLDRESRKEEA